MGVSVRWSRWLAASILAATVVLVPSIAGAIVVERVVAVVGEKAILLTDLRKRARPFLVRLYNAVPAGPQRAAHESRIMAQMIEVMVDEELEALIAARQATQVTSEEVDKALANIARASGVSLSELFESIRAETGMTEVEYREAIRRQVLEGKLLNRMIQNQRITEKDLEEMFNRVKMQEREILLFNPAWIVLRLGESPDAELLASRKAFAEDLVKRVREGGDFKDLAKRYSEDPDTAELGGDLGIRAPAGSPKASEGKGYKMVVEELEEKAMALEPGQVSDPFVFKDAVVIFTVLTRQPSRYTSFEASREEMFERVRGEKLQGIKKKWLRDLRRRTHVDVRL
jgi:peptidyl-prolyl cis-trans isomerase SurA